MEKHDKYPKEYYLTESNNGSRRRFSQLELNSENQEIDNIHISSIFEDPKIQLVCGEDDDRAKVNARAYPYKMICRLIINDKNGIDQYVGSGFFISPRCVITSGHCIFYKSNWAESVIVIPGDNGSNDRRPLGSQKSNVFKSVKGWTRIKNRDFDYGAVILPDNSLYEKVGGFFSVTILTSNMDLLNSGYPSDKKYQQWKCSGQTKELTSHRIFYEIDTVKGNSGSPILVENNGSLKVVGIHSYGNCPNYCVKVNNTILNVWNKWKQL